MQIHNIIAVYFLRLLWKFFQYMINFDHLIDPLHLFIKVCKNNNTKDNQKYIQA